MFNLRATVGLGLVALYHVVGAKTVQLPPPTGKYNIGASKHVIPLYAENDPTSPTGIQSEYLATLYYPTLDKPCKLAPYLEPETARLIAGAYRIANGTLESLTASVKWNASYLPGTVGESPYPTLLFGPGGTGPPSECYLTMIGDLVSHGYTVAALDHPYEQPFIRFPNGTGLIGLPTDFVPTEEFIARLTELRVADNLHFLSIFSDLVKDLEAPFNTTSFGAFGHSLGGATAFGAAIHSDLILSALNMDGANWGKPGVDGPEADVGKPVVQLGQDMHTPELDATWGTFPKWQTGWWRTILVAGSQHLDFSDATFWKTVDTNFTRGPIDGLRMVDVTRTYLKAFFDETLLGKEQPILDGPSEEWPEVTIYDGSSI
ncbi:putative 1-alkyl-2-acetylglycerophosphocholine esterase [Paramyrothecium foliicola]|nr:putative 1-alkyl-2-acetylglycerophosphocholine esterase [Paramyrothecium foliicola]